MNFGFYGFPNSTPDIIDIKEFDVSGSYTIPKGARFMAVLLIGGGGGGGGGRKSASGTNAYGGGGGGGGGKVYGIVELPLWELTAGTSILVSLGAGGTAGTGAATNDTNGGAGGAGGFSSLRINYVTNYTWAIAPGGSGGSGGTTTTGFAGAGGANITPYGGSSAMAAQVGTGGAGSTNAQGGAVTIQHWGYNGGAGGGGVSNLGSTQQGGNIQFASAPSAILASYRYAGGNANTAGALIGGGNTGAPGANAYTAMDSIMGWANGIGPGYGGAGGGGGVVSGGSGGNGYRGSGGGGGGASQNGVTPSGAGGTGGNGYACFWVW